MKRSNDNIIGNSPALADALDHISQLAPISRPVLILGERGTGKELAAQRMHFLSQRWDAPLLKVNCAAMAETLLESELFGHEPGAFTGATRAHIGRFERADGGSLFLDELGTMSARLQEKLLRVVEYGEFERLGGQKAIAVDVRVIAATNADLPAMARAGNFRADLLDRLSFDVVHLPPLRQRSEDIAELANHFAVQMSAELGWELFPGFSPAAFDTLLSHDWPGNVRELKNAVERSLYRWGTAELPVDEIVIDPFQQPWAEAPAAAATAPDTATAAAPERQVDDLNAHINAVERQCLVSALARHDHHQRRAADALGLSYDQMRGLVRKHKLSRRQRN
ncbi:phage shock protein operon transcriptional activator [Haliea sp. E17]|uniref:phage shock protein operon transcriptional activator n=1 Tax=Haliea sp. E17 TaxID=3401576 RepID=UPI003AAF2EA0